MRSRKSLFVAVAGLTVLLLQLVSCDFEPKDVVFYVWEEEEWVDGRHVVCRYDDSLFSHGLPDSSRCYPYTMHNVFCREESGLLGDTISDEDKSQKWYELFFLHRASGRVDTLYSPAYRNCSSSIMGLGYVSGGKKCGEWLVLECKKPGKIVGRDDLYNVKPLNQYGPLGVSMMDCTYKGQEKVFESPIVDYWIASQHTPNLYGPFTKMELKAWMDRLGIPRPMRLYVPYDRYTYARDSIGDFPDEEPKAFRWPHHHSRKGTLIE